MAEQKDARMSLAHVNATRKIFGFAVSPGRPRLSTAKMITAAPTTMTTMLAARLSYLPTYLLTYLLTALLPDLLTYLLTYLLTDLLN